MSTFAFPATRVGGPNGRAISPAERETNSILYFLQVDCAKALRFGRYGVARELEAKMSRLTSPTTGEEIAEESTEVGRYA